MGKQKHVEKEISLRSSEADVVARYRKMPILKEDVGKECTRARIMPISSHFSNIAIVNNLPDKVEIDGRAMRKQQKYINRRNKNIFASANAAGM